MVDGERLLLVEDDAATREVLTLLLRAEGWAVEAAESGEAALESFAQSEVRPAAVLCDLHLPGVCGVDLAHALRKVAGDGVLIAMTASVRAGSEAGYDAVLGKPFEAGAVESAWRMWMGLDAEGRMLRVDGVPGEGDAVLDVAVVEMLRRTMGEDGARGFYVFALADADERIARMGIAAAGEDTAAFVREAHALKGSCGMVGARRLWRLADSAESGGLRVGSAQAVGAMRVETGLVRRMLQTFFSI